MRSLTALDMAEHLNEGETLERLLPRPPCWKPDRSAWQGKPATVLVVSLAPLLSPPSLRRAVKEVTAQARVWLARTAPPWPTAAT